MQLFTYLTAGQVRTARRVGPYGIDLFLASAELPDHGGQVSYSLLDLFAMEGALDSIREATNWILARDRPEWDAYYQRGLVFDFDSAHLLLPVPVPGKIICAAGNYPAVLPPQPPQHPTIFLKPSGGVAAHRQPVVVPALVANAAYEVELALVIGKTARNVSPDAALDYVAGCTLGNDIGDRVLEKRTSQWTSGKMFDTFTPLGPCLVTLDELEDINRLEMVTRLNGQVVQRGSTAEMFFGPARLVSLLSELTTLCPGDVILTGSPKLLDGQPQPLLSLRPGDIVEVEIDKIGTLCNPVVAEGR